MNMDKIHDKANHPVDDIRKKKNTVANDINKDSSNKKPDSIPISSYKCCIYCQKVFYNSKFLMKHLLRRHSDELVILYRNLASRESNNPSDVQYLIEVLKKEFLNLKNELCTAKLVVAGRNEMDSCEKSPITDGEETVHRNKTNQNTNGDVVSNEIRDLKVKMLDVEKDIKNLNDKFVELDNVLKNEIIMRANINEKLVLSKDKIMQAQESQFIELKQILLSELQSQLFNQGQEISNNWKLQLAELRREIKRLDWAINNVKQQICTDSLKEEIKRELVPHIIPHISEKKVRTSLRKSELSNDESYHIPKHKDLSKHKNSVHRDSHSESFQNHSEVTPETDDGLVADLHKAELSVNKSYCTPQQKNMSKHANSGHRESNSNSFQNNSIVNVGTNNDLGAGLLKTKSPVNNSYCTSKQTDVSKHQNPGQCVSNSKSFQNHSMGTVESYDEIASLVADRLSQFSIAPNTTKISDAECNNIKKLVNMAKELCHKKYPNFDKIYNRLNMQADQQAQNEFKNKKNHEVRFSEPLTSSRNSLDHSVTSHESGIHEKSSSIKSSKLKNKNRYKRKLPEPLTSSRGSLDQSITSYEDGTIHELSPVVDKGYKPYTCAKTSKSSNSKPVPQKESDSARVSKSVTYTNTTQKESHPICESFTFSDKGARGDSVYPFSNKQNILVRHAASVKGFEISDPIEDILKSKDLNATFTISSAVTDNAEDLNATIPKVSSTVIQKSSDLKSFSKDSHSVIADAEHKKHNRVLKSVSPVEKIKLNSAMHNHSVRFKEIQDLKSFDKLSEIEENSKYEDDFDDVSSLESYKSSDDDKN